MNIDRLAQSWNTAAARDCNVDTRRDDVRQPVAGKCSDQTECASWRAMRDLQQILVDLGLKTIRLLTNNPKKVVGLEGYGLEIVEQVPIRIKPNPHNARYLKTKRDKLGHLM